MSKTKGRAPMLRYAFCLSVLSLTLVISDKAQAQSAVATVNGDPITARDVDQRMRIASMLFRQPLSRPAAIQELIDDRVKLNEGRRIGMRVTAAGLDDALGQLASRARQPVVQFEQNLSKAGIDPDAVKAKLNAQIVWGELLRQRARSGNISNSELNAEVERRAAKGEATVTDFVIRQIVFVVPAGSNPGQREREANAARARFNDCDSGVEYMRSLRDVAVKERIGRTSTELPKQTNDLLQKTAIGRTTPAFRSEQGIELIAVCEKSDRQDRIQLRNQVEREMLERRTEGSAASYLNELKSKVEIRR
jgi:peptidyl-prolyl cis-trans isomerase SurA